jgi:hypothetical protein
MDLQLKKEQEGLIKEDQCLSKIVMMEVQIANERENQGKHLAFYFQMFKKVSIVDMRDRKDTKKRKFLNDQCLSMFKIFFNKTNQSKCDLIYVDLIEKYLWEIG